MKSLFDKTILKNLELKNRFIRSATWEGMAENGHVTDKLLNIYNNLSKGGCAAIITGYAYIHDDEQPTYCMLGASNDSYIDDFKRLTDTVHANDTKIILQLAYGGTQTKYNIDNRIIWGPSSLEHKQTKVMAKEMTKEELKLLAELFADAALRGKIGGFDGVQIHCAHGYLLSQFLSPYYNRRSDEYGGPIENKARILYEIISKVQEKVGVNFPVLVKINCSDFDNDEGLEFEEAKYVCKELAK
ncbi:MAG: NADH:flavin oxidoreductase, partial [Cyanobacteriota bacterium]